MTIAQGVFKQTRFKRQAGKGTLATTSAGQVLRRDSATFELQKETYDTNNEIISAQQMQSFSHGPKKIVAAIKGLLSPGTWWDPLSALLRRDFTAVAAMTGLTITIAASGSFFTLTRSAGSWLTDGLKVGHVGRLTAGAFNAANLNKNLQVVDIPSATVATVRVLNPSVVSALVAEGPIASATFTLPGKTTYVPVSGHTNVYFTFEDFWSDIAQSERNQDIQIGQASITLPGSGNATIDLSGEGLDQTQATSAYFGTPTAETTTDVCAAASGSLVLNGVALGTVTNLQFTINGQVAAADGVVGTNLRPDVFRDKVLVQGSFSMYFEDYSVAQLFPPETEFTIAHAVTAGSLAAAEFVANCFPRVKLSSSTPEDNNSNQKRTFNFTAIYNVNGGAGIKTEKTTIQVQDSQAP
jgi:hypothetical protein